MSERLELEITWERGGRARLLETDGEQVVFESDVPAAPGTPLAGLARRVSGGADQGGAGADELVRYEVKIRGCRRSAPGAATFRLEGRFVNLSSKERTRLLGG